jgi:fatty-acyl-CoA synthase
MALVVLRSGEATDEQTLIDFCRTRLAHFKCPTRVELVPELPRTATGKLQKFKLREKYWSDSDRRVSGG